MVMSLTPAAPPRPGRRKWRVAVGLGAVLLAAVAVWWGTRPALPEVTSAELITVEDRLVWRTNQAPFTGWLLERYSDGSLKSRSKLRDGRLHGISTAWYTNGLRQIEEHYSAGVSDGPRITWHPDGTRRSEAMVRQGQITGVFRRWYLNGQMAEEMTMKNGKAHGPSRVWYPSGSLQTEAEMVEGAVIRQQSWAEGERPSPGTPRAPQEDGR